MANRYTDRNHKAVIVCSREPVPGHTKTRMMPYLTAEQCAELHTCFINDLANECGKVSADIVIFYTTPDDAYESDTECPILYEAFGPKAFYFKQQGHDIWERMDYAIRKTLDLGYQSCILVGTDIPELEADSLEYALSMLTEHDVVLGPSTDGGYHLVGMNEAHSELFDAGAKAEPDRVLEDTIEAARAAGLSCCTVDEYTDIDDRDDISGYRARMRTDGVLRKSYTGRFLRDCAKISVIVPVYNEEKIIETFQEQLRDCTLDVEIIFADGGSTDRTVELISDEFKVIHADKGRAAQMNAGAVESTGDILFFLHCDCEIPEDAFTEIRECMTRSEYGCFGVKFDSKHPLMLTNRIISNHRAWKRGMPFGDQGIFIDRQLFFEIGMFKEIPVMEDYELSRKLRRYGYMPAKTRHRIRTSARRYGESTLSIMRTEYEMWNMRRLYRKGVSADEVGRDYSDVR